MLKQSTAPDDPSSSRPKDDNRLPEMLEAAWRQHGAGLSADELRQTTLPLASIYTAPLTFQPRNPARERWTKRSHVTTLTRAIRQRGKLDPLDVFAIAGKVYVVNGHCRLSAYWQAGWKGTRKVPVKWIRHGKEPATFTDAFLFASQANAKDALPLTLFEKTECAWARVKFNERRSCYSLREIAAATGISKSTVGNMTRALAENNPRGLRFMPWWRVKEARRGDTGWTPEKADAETRKLSERQRETFADLGNKSPRLMLDATLLSWPHMEPLIREWARTRDEEETKEEPQESAQEYIQRADRDEGLNLSGV